MCKVEQRAETYLLTDDLVVDFVWLRKIREDSVTTDTEVQDFAEDNGALEFLAALGIASVPLAAPVNLCFSSKKRVLKMKENSYTWAVDIKL